jgi:hypothetical protein
MQGSDEFLDLRPSDSPARAVSLGLGINAIQPQRMLPDHSIQALISRLAEVFCRSGRTAIAHGRQDRQDEPFQEGGLSLANPVQRLCGHGGIRFVYRRGNRLTWSGLIPSQLRLTGLPGGMGAALELDKLGELRQHPDIHTLRMRGGHLPPVTSDTDHSPLRAAHQASLMHVRNCPVQPVGEQRRSTGNLGPQIVLGQAKPLSEDCAKLGKRVVAVIGQGAQNRCHQRLVIRYWHSFSLPAIATDRLESKISATQTLHDQLGNWLVMPR